jgi:amino acid transporter
MSDDAQSAKADQTRTYLGFLVIVIALVIVVIVFLAGVGKLTASADVATAVGSVTTVIGTLVGFFFGNSAGSAGKEKAETARQNAQKKLNLVAASGGDPERIRAILER